MSFWRVINQLLNCLLIIGLLASSASASNYVWCVSADGDHSVLEFAPSGDCSQDDCSPAAEGIAVSALEANTADGCGPCLDVSSAHQWNVSRNRAGDFSVDLPATLPLVALDAFNSLPEQFLNTYQLVDPPPRIPDQILRHRTTVLLI